MKKMLVLCALMLVALTPALNAKEDGKELKIGDGFFYKNVEKVTTPFPRFEFELINRSGKDYARARFEVDLLDKEGKRLTQGYIVYKGLKNGESYRVYIPISATIVESFEMEFEDGI